MRNKWIPTNSDFKKAWRIKKKGGCSRDIRQKLNIGAGQWEQNRHLFNAQFAHFKKLEKRQQALKRPDPNAVKPIAKFSGPNCRIGERKLRPIDINQDTLKSYVICGFNHEKIAEHLGISRNTLLSLRRESPEIERILSRGREETAADVLKGGLLPLCKEHTIKDTHFASHQGEIFSREYDKRFRPHLGAIKYLLSNTIGWQSESKPKPINNKGAILRMMDEVAGMDETTAPAGESENGSSESSEDSDQRDNTPTGEAETETEDQ